MQKWLFTYFLEKQYICFSNFFSGVSIQKWRVAINTIFEIFNVPRLGAVAAA